MLWFLIVVCGLMGGALGIGYSSLLDRWGFLAPVAAAWWTNETIGLFIGIIVGYVVWRVRKEKMRLDGSIINLRRKLGEELTKNQNSDEFADTFQLGPSIQRQVTLMLHTQAEICGIAHGELGLFEQKGLSAGQFPEDIYFKVALDRLNRNVMNSDAQFNRLYDMADRRMWRVGLRSYEDHLMFHEELPAEPGCLRVGG